MLFSVYFVCARPYDVCHFLVLLEGVAVVVADRAWFSVLKLRSIASYEIVTQASRMAPTNWKFMVGFKLCKTEMFPNNLCFSVYFHVCSSSGFAVLLSLWCLCSRSISVDFSLFRLTLYDGSWKPVPFLVLFLFWTCDIWVDTRRITSPDNQYELDVNVFQKMSYLNSSDIRHMVLLTSVHPPVHEVEPVTISTTTPATTTTKEVTSTTQKPKSCPHPEYKQFEDFNCYKGYMEKKKWIDARYQCKRDGGELMVLESVGERKEVFPTMYKSVKKDKWRPWMGVYKDTSDNSWVSVTGPEFSSWQAGPYCFHYTPELASQGRQQLDEEELGLMRGSVLVSSSTLTYHCVYPISLYMTSYSCASALSLKQSATL
ncbi:uncharacterized protein [Anabrus simplex]|uniref:uncharacterized protein isoform X2 n=1 Tax=Anabrus simplex TaxID=316456 RepID=UPI0035A37791